MDPYSRINEVSQLKNVDADLLILGNSRAVCGYNDSLMSQLTGMRCLNLGWQGHTFDLEYHLIYQTYLRQNSKPRYIIVDVSPVGFFAQEGPLYRIEMLPFINRPEFQYYVNICPELSWADRFIFVRYFGKLGKVLKEIDKLNHPVVTKKEENPWKRNYNRPEKLKLENDKNIILLFDHFLDECKEQNINVILVCSPFHIREGSSYHDMNGFWSIVKWCNYGTGFPMVTYQDFFYSDTLYFIDPVHLNERGRTIFTEKLMHDLDSVEIIKQQNTNDR